MIEVAAFIVVLVVVALLSAILPAKRREHAMWACLAIGIPLGLYTDFVAENGEGPNCAMFGFPIWFGLAWLGGSVARRVTQALCLQHSAKRLNKLAARVKAT